jgi:hypothetical protein
MSEEETDTPAPDSSPPSDSGPARESAAKGSIGFSEGYRGVDVVNFAPVSNVPEPGGLPPATSDPGGAAPLGDGAAAESEPPPASSEE